MDKYPDNSNISLSYQYYNKGLQFEEKGKHEQALKEFENALKEHPEHTGAIHHKKINLIILGRMDEAIDYF